ncbi:MAG: hypothetical protein LBK74_04000 [Treponema sp.]|jgi:phosphoribosylamine-glycine ligase|nr:hypothetical protein [Treponema sp.]
MQTAVIGSGGREHAAAWKPAQSEWVEKVYVIPRNGGKAGTRPPLAPLVPLVIKAGGLAAGKRVVIAPSSPETAEEAVNAFMRDRPLGGAGPNTDGMGFHRDIGLPQAEADRYGR